MNERDLDELISDEALRKRIRELLPTPERPRSWSDRLKHPLIMLIAGFLLTGVLGTQLTRYWNDKQRQREVAVAREEASLEAAQRAAQELAQVVDTHHGSALILMRELAANSDAAQLASAKRRYDDAMAGWLGQYHASLLTLRGAIGTVGYSPIDGLIQETYGPLAVRTDSLLRAHAARPALVRAPAAEYNTMKDCGRAVLSQLFLLLAARQTNDSQPGVSKDDLANVQLLCGTSNATTQPA